MTDMICRKSMMRCQTPGTCSPHGGCQGSSNWFDICRALAEERDRLKEDNESLRKVANELRCWAQCENVHHSKEERHEYDFECKVLARIDGILSKKS